MSVVACYELVRFRPGVFGIGLGLCSDSGHLSRTLPYRDLGPALQVLNTDWEKSGPTN